MITLRFRGPIEIDDLAARILEHLLKSAKHDDVANEMRGYEGELLVASDISAAMNRLLEQVGQITRARRTAISALEDVGISIDSATQ